MNFLIAGAMRCGTTALARFLSQHPEVGMAAQKEVHFFDAPDFDDRSDPAEIAGRYHAHFPENRDRPLTGEATPIYLYLPSAIRRIARYNPEMKFLVLLRDPVDRALSHYRHSVVHRWERAPLPLALLLEPFRVAGRRRDLAWDSPLRRYTYLDRGFYARQLDFLHRHFPPDQVLILPNRRLREDHAGTLQTVYAFLGIQERNVIPPPEIANGMGMPYAPEWFKQALRLFYLADQKRLASRWPVLL